MLQMDTEVRSRFSSAIAADAPELIEAVLAKTSLRDLQGLITCLEYCGLDEQVASWLGNGVNMAVSPAQLYDALGHDLVCDFAEHLGVPPGEALNLVAEHLPATVDFASPDGVLHVG